MVSRVEQKILQDLRDYLGDDYDEKQDAALLICVRRAIRSFKNKRHYPEEYSENIIEKDMDKLYSCIFDLALYWVGKQGVEFHKSFSGNGESRSWDSEADVYALHNVIPIARII